MTEASHDTFAQDCAKLHSLVRCLPRFTIPVYNSSDEKSLAFAALESIVPKNGVYILFEQGEFGHQEGKHTERIVRIGTHTENDRLAERLLDHFKKENKNSSIFRKNIGRAYLCQTDKDLLPAWDEKTVSRANNEAVACVETWVTDYMHKAFTFCIIPMPNSNDQERTQLEKFLIQTVSLCPVCKASRTWLGASSPKEQVVGSFLWLSQHVGTRPDGSVTMADVEQYIRSGHV